MADVGALEREADEAAALGIEGARPLVIVIAILFGTGRFLLHTSQGRIDSSARD